MRLIALALLLPIAGCATAQPEPPVLGEGNCRNETLARFTGQPATQQLGAQMLAESGARILRWVPRGMMVTMEYRSDRVTVMLDEANRIERASCG